MNLSKTRLNEVQDIERARPCLKKKKKKKKQKKKKKKTEKKKKN